MSVNKDTEERGQAAEFPRPRLGISRFFAPIAVVLALISALITFLVLTGLTPIPPTHNVVVGVLLGNAAMVALLALIVAWEIWGLFRARRRGRAAARLHVRIVVLFGIVAVVPAILVAVIASITLDRGLDRWFSARTRAIIGDAVVIAQSLCARASVRNPRRRSRFGRRSLADSEHLSGEPRAVSSDSDRPGPGSRVCRP